SPPIDGFGVSYDITISCGIRRGCWEVRSSLSGGREETRSLQSVMSPVARDNCLLRGIVEGTNSEFLHSTRSGNVYCEGLLLRRTPPPHRSVHQTPTQLWIVEPAPRECYAHLYTNVSRTRRTPTYDLTNTQCYWFVGTVFEALKSLRVPHDLGYCILIGAKASSSSAGVTLLRQGTDILETRETVGHQRYRHTHVLLDLAVTCTIYST
ncbi:hypothetical protein EDD17DRAFT_1650843, partial [Pisolithus thermaeus]